MIGYTLSVIRDDAGHAVGAVLFFKDLTRVEQQEERERLRDRLASLGEMAAGIAHELKNPLAGIEVMAGLLRRQVPDSPDAQSLLADIISEAKLANAIVVEMLEFVRPVRLQMEQTRHRRRAASGGDARREQGRPAATRSVKLDIAPDLPCIDGDHHQLCQVFTNLLINAFEALDGTGADRAERRGRSAGAGSGLRRRRQAPTPRVVIDVVDNGPGIPPELRDKVFDPFFTTKVQGSGLGLPIVRKIVDAHDGRIDLVSGPGQGTRFRVTIPVSSASSWLGKVERSVQARTCMGRILIADDHDALRRGLVRGLTESGHEVEEASNGNAAIERLHDGYFDVVLSDLKMGGSDGLDVLRTTRALHPTTAVILMTAFGTVNTAVDAMKIGAFDYVQKPFEIEEMELEDRQGAGSQAPEERDRLPPPYAAGHLRLRQDRRLERLAAARARHRQEGGQEQHDGADPRRNGDRQGADRGRHAPQLAPRRRATSSRSTARRCRRTCSSRELFGHEKGAFTGADKQRIGRFEQADGGTLFLDEIGDMSPSTQAKILRVLQEHEFERLGGTRTLRVDVRLIAATNRDLPAMVQAGEFREDLYYRLNVVSIEMPPLRERKDDIVPLANSFIRRFAARAEEEDRRARSRRAEAADALQLAGQHPRARERHRARDAPGRRPRDRRRRSAARRDAVVAAAAIRRRW